jgi:hypothetical protein
VQGKCRGKEITHFFIRNGIHRNEEIIQGKNLQPASRSRVLRAGGLERFWAPFPHRWPGNSLEASPSHLHQSIAELCSACDVGTMERPSLSNEGLPHFSRRIFIWLAHRHSESGCIRCIAGASLARLCLASDARTGAEQIPPFSEAPNLPDGAALEGA